MSPKLRDRSRTPAPKKDAGKTGRGGVPASGGRTRNSTGRGRGPGAPIAPQEVLGAANDVIEPECAICNKGPDEVSFPEVRYPDGTLHCFRNGCEQHYEAWKKTHLQVVVYHPPVCCNPRQVGLGKPQV
jgi:hypothetical protein